MLRPVPRITSSRYVEAGGRLGADLQQEEEDGGGGRARNKGERTHCEGGEGKF